MNINRFWSKVSVGEPDECWLWLNALSEQGYGQFRVGKNKVRAHRAAYEIANGSISDGLIVLHSCDNRACCNPHHLTLGTHQDNMDDKVRKGRATGGNKLKESDVIAIRGDKRKHADLAKEYDVSYMTIVQIRSFRTWKHIK